MSVQPCLRGSNELRVGRKMATFQLFFSVGSNQGLISTPVLLKCLTVLLYVRKCNLVNTNMKSTKLRFAFFWDVTQHTIIICYRRFGTTVGPCFKGWAFFLGCLTLEEWTESWPETSVTKYLFTLRKIPERRRAHLNDGRSLKSRLCLLAWSNFTKSKNTYSILLM